MKELRSILNLSWSNGVPADLVTPRANALTNGNRKNTNAVIPYRSVDSVVSLRNVAHSQEQHVVLFSFFFFDGVSTWSMLRCQTTRPLQDLDTTRSRDQCRAV